MPGLKISGARRRFGAVRAVDNVDLEVGEGEFFTLLGPSGCGKTTLLRILAGLEQQTSGRVLIGGRDVSNLPPRSRGLAMVFQNYAVFPHLRVRDNIAFGLTMAGADKARIDRQVARSADLMHIEMLLDRYPAALSGGQRQRVALARALVADPAVVLCDEITSALDVSVQASILELLGELRRASGLAMIFVTHDLGVLRAVADRALVLQSGHVREAGDVAQLLEAPRHEYSVTLVRSIPDPAAVHLGGSR